MTQNTAGDIQHNKPIGATPHEFCVTLRFFGDDLDPAEVTSLLGCEPTHAQLSGDVVTGRSGRSRTVPRGNWRLATESSSVDIEEQLLQLFARVTDDPAVWRTLTKRFQADVFCGVFPARSQLGFTLSPHLHRLLAERDLPLVFDVYPQDPSSDAI